MQSASTGVMEPKTTDPLRVLLVEDSEEDALLVRRHLAPRAGGVEMQRVECALDMASAMDRSSWDVVISDYQMPVFDGLSALRLVRARDADIPFILVSASVARDVAIGAMKAGANDFVMKDELARLAPAIDRELRSARDRARNQLAQRSVEDLHARLQFHDRYDAVTGVPNRAHFLDRLAERVAASRGSPRKLSVACVDLDRFGLVNATLGRAAGDELLTQCARRLRECVRDPDDVARVGAGRFALILGEEQGAQHIAQRVAKLLGSCFDAPYLLDGSDLRVQGRAGVSVFPDDGILAEPLLTCAEAAVAGAKAAAQHHLFYTRQMTQRSAERLDLEHKLRRALDNDEFDLHYQPKVRAEGGRIAGVEALIRWTRHVGAPVSPARFIPVLEETGMIHEVGAWVIERALRDRRAWVDAPGGAPRIAVNVSVNQLDRDDFVDTLARALQRQGAGGIDIEITESLLVGDVDSGIEKLKAVAALGCEVFIDDFGTGYSSLAYLARLPIHGIKIDRSFVASVAYDPTTVALVTAVVAMARSLKLKVVAEGVETRAQADALRAVGCGQLQGYFTGRPMPSEEVGRLLRRR